MLAGDLLLTAGQPILAKKQPRLRLNIILKR
jgi:hypothetical protein